MGSLVSKDTRCISFDNTLEFTPIKSIRSIEDDTNALNLTEITAVTEKHDDSLVSEGFHTGDLNNKGEKDIDYWANRIETLKQEHRAINQIIESEFENTLAIYNNLKLTQNVSYDPNKTKPCLEWRAKILQCYEEHSREPLACSAVVQAFNECVNNCTVQQI